MPTFAESLVLEKTAILARLLEIAQGDTQDRNEYRDSLSKRLRDIDKQLDDLGVGADGTSAGPFEIHSEGFT